MSSTGKEGFRGESRSVTPPVTTLTNTLSRKQQKLERRTQDPALATLPPLTAQGAGGRGEGKHGNVSLVINIVFSERRAVKGKWLPEVTRGNRPTDIVFYEQKKELL